ncbi:MAG: recombinase family protein [Clostridia bacterium]|nr:recombinase family protein [Clostridia bacterium]
MRGVIYARYSHGPRQTEQSIEGQLRECNAYAKANNIDIINAYIDRKQSGRTDNREDFQRMLRESKRKLYDVVIVWKIDRFGRNREEIAKNKAVLRMNGVRVISACESIPEGPEGIILESVLEGLAEYYSANLSQNIVRGMRENAMKGKSCGAGLSLGYKIDKDHKFQLDPVGAAVVQEIFKLCDEGKKIAQIQRYLNEKGYKTSRGCKFTIDGVSRILRNRQYIGEYRWSDIVSPNAMPQIIDNELFERVQKRLELNKKAPAARRLDVDFLLTGKVYCGKCGDHVAGDSGTSRSGDKHYYYTCHSKKQLHVCKKKSVKKEWLEREVTKIAVMYVLRDDVIQYIARRVVEIQKKENADKSMLKYLNDRLREAEKSIKNIMKAIEAGIITETTQERLLELEATRHDLQIEIEKEKITRPTLEREQVVCYLEKFKGGNIDDKEYQTRIIEMFVNKVILYEDKIIITFNYSGENNEISLEVIEEAAEEAFAELQMCSNEVLLARPKLQELIVLGVFTSYFKSHINCTEDKL